MADAYCTCGHPRGRHVEILSHHSAIHGERWCRDCECKQFKTAKRWSSGELADEDDWRGDDR